VVVGPTPAAVAERHKRVLETAITKVENFYASWLDDVSIAEAGGATVRTSASRYDLSIAEDKPPANEISETEAEAGDVTPTVVGKDASETSGLVAAPTYLIPIIVEGNARLGNRFSGTTVGNPESMMMGALAATVVASSFHELGWATSSACGVCQKLALCIDQSQCWHRADH
jgi:hypothetical protein